MRHPLENTAAPVLTPTTTNFTEGPAATVHWYRAHQDWWRPHKQQAQAKYALAGQ